MVRRRLMCMKGHLMVRGGRLLLVLLITLGMGLFPARSFAGDGELQGGRFNLSVSMRFDADEALIAPGGELNQVFQQASDLLCDATDGQHQLGTITVFDNHEGRDVDINIFQNQAGQENRSRATLRDDTFFGLIKHGLGGIGTMDLFMGDLPVQMGPNDGAHTIVHELGHYAYGAYDEYADNTSVACIDISRNPNSGQASLMENYTAGHQVGNQIVVISEFCVAGNHDPNNDTPQERERGKSVWETMHDFFPDLVVPNGLPQDAPPATCEPIEWRRMASDTRFVLAIDTSGSMDGAKLTSAQLGAAAFTRLTLPGEKLAIVAFSDSADVVSPLTEMNLASRAAAIAQIATLFAFGDTAIGDALRASLNQIIAEGLPTSPQAVILLSDGLQNAGVESPDDVIPALRNERVPVFTIGIGDDVDEELMKRIASETGGNYFRPLTPFNMIVDFIRLALEVRGGGAVASAPRQIAAAEVQETPALIDPTTTQAVFAVVWEGAAPDLDLTLIRPDGSRVDPATANTDPDIEFIQQEQTEMYMVANPAAGEWRLAVEAVTAPQAVSYVAEALADSNVVHFAVSTTKDQYVAPEPIVVQALPRYHVPVIGARIEGTVIRPDGSSVPIALFDDGDDAHADSIANDGIYSNVYSNYTEDGTYTFDLTVTNESGMQIPGEAIFNFPDTGTLIAPDPLPTDPFVRKAEVSVVVSGVSQAQPDLVVQEVVATEDDVRVVIENQGVVPVPANQGFWVDLYIDPSEPPTQPNQIWNHLSDEGLVWGVDGDVLPMDPGEVITLTVNDALYWPDLSQFSGSLPVGTPVYVQVDSANADTTYGGVLETHEAAGAAYNNVAGPVPAVAAAAQEQVFLPLLSTPGQAATAGDLGDGPRYTLPPRIDQETEQ